MQVTSVKRSENEIRELIFQLQSGDEAAYSDLLEIFNPLIASAVANFVRFLTEGYDEEDIRQDARLALYQASLSYDLHQIKVTFGLYAKICINNALTTKFKRAGKKLPFNFCSLDELDESVGFTADDISSALIDSETYIELDSKIKGCLSEYEYKVFCMYVEGFGRSEIASNLGKDEKSVSNAVQRVTEKLRKIIKR